MTRRLVATSEILDIAQYELARPEFRSRVMEIKNRRRVQVGPNFTFLFENHDTVLYQIQEMMRVERIVDDKAIQYEMKTYNELIPPVGGLAATLLLEYETKDERDKVLPRFKGIEEHIWLALDDFPRIQGNFDRRQIGEERVSSVQYLQFPLDTVQRESWAGAAVIRLIVDHPLYRHEAALSPDVAAALAEDFAQTE